MAARDSGVKMSAAFGRLCVETFQLWRVAPLLQSAAFGRLCVETHQSMQGRLEWGLSRLRAAVC